MEMKTTYLVFLKYMWKWRRKYLKIWFSLYGHISASLNLNPRLKGTNFTINEGNFVEIRTMHLFFGNIYGRREEDFLEEFNTFLLVGYTEPALQYKTPN